MHIVTVTREGRRLYSSREKNPTLPHKRTIIQLANTIRKRKKNKKK